MIEKIRVFLKRFLFLARLWFNPEEKIKLMLKRAREDEKKRVTSDWKARYQQMEERLEKDKNLITQELEAKIESHVEEIRERDLKIKNIEEIFNYCWEQTKSNMNLASELKVQVWKAQKNQTNTYQAINKVVDKADTYMETFKKKEVKFKELLGWR